MTGMCLSVVFEASALVDAWRLLRSYPGAFYAAMAVLPTNGRSGGFDVVD